MKPRVLVLSCALVALSSCAPYGSASPRNAFARVWIEFASGAARAGTTGGDGVRDLTVVSRRRLGAASCDVDAVAGRAELSFAGPSILDRAEIVDAFRDADHAVGLVTIEVRGRFLEGGREFVVERTGQKFRLAAARRRPEGAFETLRARLEPAGHLVEVTAPDGR